MGTSDWVTGQLCFTAPGFSMSECSVPLGSCGHQSGCYRGLSPFPSAFSCFRRLLGNKTHLKLNLVVFVLLKYWLICCLFAADETFTVEEAVETIGFGRFHVLLFFIMGGASVRINQSINQSADQS